MPKDKDSWDPLASSLDFLPLDPKAFEYLETNDGRGTKMAKDKDYATAVLKHWKLEQSKWDDNVKMEWSPVTYYAESSQPSVNVPLHGHIVRRKQAVDESLEDKNAFGVLLFHTGAGPHDVFLLWKAASLVNRFSSLVLIADILSDEIGWAWDSDRSKYETVRKDVFQPDIASGSTRPELQRRVKAALDAMSSIKQGLPLAALGWCLGGYSIMELCRMNHPSIRAMVTFHGVFGDKLSPIVEEEAINGHHESDSLRKRTCEVLVCHGCEDPFVSSESLEGALATFQENTCLATLLQLKGAKHGFTNPAQDFNSNPSFSYHEESAEKAWRQCVALLGRRLEKK